MAPEAMEAAAEAAAREEHDYNRLVVHGLSYHRVGWGHRPTAPAAALAAPAAALACHACNHPAPPSKTPPRHPFPAALRGNPQRQYRRLLDMYSSLKKQKIGQLEALVEEQDGNMAAVREVRDGAGEMFWVLAWPAGLHCRLHALL